MKHKISLNLSVDLDATGRWHKHPVKRARWGWALTSALLLALLAGPAWAEGVTDLAVGDTHACALKDGKVFCWGPTLYTGHGNPASHLPVGKLYTTPYPVKAANGFTNNNVIAVSSLYNHTCAIEGASASATSGVLYCWGRNNETNTSIPSVRWNYGAIGDGTTTHAYEPKKVLANDGFTNTNVTHVSTGWTHTCAIEGGEVYCWGNSLGGALGNGTGQPLSIFSTTPPSNTTLTPQKVLDANGTVGTAGGFRNNQVTAVTAGNTFTCAIQGGQLFCWGLNGVGELGVGVLDPSTPSTARGIIDNTVPRDVVSNAGFNPASVQAVSANNQFACAVTNSGDVYCWGGGLYGRLGNNDTANSASPVQVTQSGFPFEDVTAISTGDDFACALKPVDGVSELYCWGNGYYGQNGQGENVLSASSITEPGMVANGVLFEPFFQNSGVSLVASGRWTSCAYQGGEVHCWGKETGGTLGRGFGPSHPVEGNLQAVSTPVPTLPLTVPRDATAVNKILAYDGSNAVPDFSDYEAAIVPGATSARVASYNTALIGLDPTEMSEVDAMVAAYNAIMAAAGDATAAAALTAADYEALGLTLTDAGVVDLINGAVGAGVLGDVDTWAKVSALVTAGNRIWAHAAAQAGAPTPRFDDYSALNLTGPVADHLVSYNSAVQAVGTTTRAEVQAAVTAYNDILSTANTPTPAINLTGATYLDVGVSDGGVALSGDVLSILNSSVSGQPTTASDTVPELQAMVTAADRITEIAAGTTGVTLEAADFSALGIVGVNADNLADVRTALAGAGAGSLTTVAEILAVIQPFISDPEAVQALVDYDGTLTPPTAQLYDDAGVTDVSGDRLAIYNGYLADVRPTDLEGIQAMVDAVNAVSDAAGDATASNALDEADYQALGLTLLDAAVLPFLNGAIANTDASGVDSPEKLAALVDGANRLWAWAASQAGAEDPIDGDYQAIGTLRTLAANTGAYNSGIQAVGTSTPAEVQAVVDAYNTLLEAATGPDPVPTALDDYTTLGITIDGDALSLVDSVVNDAASDDIDTVEELQALVDGAQKVLQTAGNSADAGLTVADFEALGLMIRESSLEAVIGLVEGADLSEVQTKEALMALLAAFLVSAIPVPTLGALGLLMLGLLIFGVMLQARHGRL